MRGLQPQLQAEGIDVLLVNIHGEAGQALTARYSFDLSPTYIVFDAVGGESRERSWRVLKPGGVLVSLRRDLPQGAGDPHGVRALTVLVRPDADQLAAIAALIDAGHVTPHVEAVYPLAQAAEAQARSQAGHVRGKLVLCVSG